MTSKVVAIGCGIAAGFGIAWARLSDPGVIRDMLLLRDAHVFLVMGSAMCVAAVGVHLLRGLKARALFTREPIEWRLERPQPRHVGGSLLFAIGWSVAGTCP